MEIRVIDRARLSALTTRKTDTGSGIRLRENRLVAHDSEQERMVDFHMCVSRVFVRVVLPIFPILCDERVLRLIRVNVFDNGFVCQELLEFRRFFLLSYTWIKSSKTSYHHIVDLVFTFHVWSFHVRPFIIEPRHQILPRKVTFF